MDRERPAAVEVANLTKHYGSVVALDGVDLKVEAGEYFVLLGPSGGGKTTLLRLIGGFIRPGRGRVLLHGRDVSALPPNERETSMVFQSYALFPHMSVERNVAYGLKLRRLPTAEIRDKVNQMLALVGLEGYNARMPHELSGGQQQRVQLARSLVLESDILLLDEPLASLDAKLRKDMCVELKRIQEKVGITFIHVTHNQEEAMTIADRIAIIADGELIEEGTPREVYERPVKRFTASFIGENNILDGRAKGANGAALDIELGFATVAIDARGMAVEPGREVTISIRSEQLQIIGAEGSDGGELESVPATYVESIYLGLTTAHLVALTNGQEIVSRLISDDAEATRFAPGEAVRVGWPRGDARLHLS